MGVHRGARDRGLPGRWRDGGRAGGTAAHGAVRDPGAVAVAAGRPGAPGAGPDPGLVLRGVATGAAAVVVGVGGPTEIVYALAVLSTIAATLYRPAHSALLPSLCHTGYELASANVVRGLLDSAATLVGPLLAAVLLAVHRRDRRVRGGGGRLVLGRSPAGAAALRRPAAPGRPAETNLVSAAVEGIRAVSQSGDLALIMGLAAAQSFTRGALTVLTVVVAIDLLGTGEPGVGDPHGRRRGRRGPGLARCVVAGRHPPPGRVVRRRGRPVGHPGHADRRLSRSRPRRWACWRSSVSATR